VKRLTYCLSSGGRLWLLVGLIALLGCGALVATVGGLMLSARVGGPAAGAAPESGGAALPKPAIPPQSTSSPKPTAVLGMAGNVLLADDFDNSKRSGLAAEQNAIATYAFVDGAYAITLKLPKHLAWSTFEGSYGDVEIEADTVLDSSAEESAAGIAFRYQDEDNFYFYRVSASGNYNLTLYKQGQQQALIDWTQSPAINRRGQVNNLRVEALGDHIRLFVNGTLLDEVSDSSFDEGEIALAVTTFSQGDVTCLFDNFVVRGRR
jgi:hypothetical protein